MAKNTKPSGAKTIIDVAHPGKSAPAGNSKSVIITNRPILKDPMMVDDTSVADSVAGNAQADDSLAKTSNKSSKHTLSAPLLEPKKPDEVADQPAETVKLSKSSTIAELAAAAAAEKPETSSEEPEPDKYEKPEAKAEPEPGTESDKPEPDTDGKPAPDKPKDDKPDNSESTTDPEETAPSKTDNTKKEEAEAAEQAKHQAAVDKLADSKQYYLPINTVEKRRSRRFVALGVLLSLLLIVAWADIALDAGLIHVGNLKAPTHFFSN